MQNLMLFFICLALVTLILTPAQDFRNSKIILFVNLFNNLRLSFWRIN